MNEATREVLALSMSELQRAQVIVRTELAHDLPPVKGDRVQLQQVVLNLVLNAAEAMSTIEDRGRQLVVRTERDEGDHVRLTVRDTGPGFDPLSAKRLFETFYTTKRRWHGDRLIDQPHDYRASSGTPVGGKSMTVPVRPLRFRSLDFPRVAALAKYRRRSDRLTCT